MYFDMGETAKTRAASFSEQFRQYPALLTSQRFWGYCLAAAFASGAFFAYLGGAPYVATTFYKMDAATLGLYFGAPAVGYMAGNFLSGRYSMRVGVNRMVLAGALFSTTGMIVLALLAFAGHDGPNVFFSLMVSVGAAQSCRVCRRVGRGLHDRRRGCTVGAGRFCAGPGHRAGTLDPVDAGHLGAVGHLYPLGDAPRARCRQHRLTRRLCKVNSGFAK